MAASEPIFSVIIDAKGVALERIEPGRPGYRKASKGAIFRQRDALELHRKLKAAGKGFDGAYVFHYIETARTFAMLHLQARDHEIQDNLDRVQAYDGTKRTAAK